MKVKHVNQQKLSTLNTLLVEFYHCTSFQELLKQMILKFHTLVMYDSGMFFCGISKDCSFFKPYLTGKIEDYYKKQPFLERQTYLSQAGAVPAEREANVYKALDYQHGLIQVPEEPRTSFLTGQNDFHIVCLRIIHQGQFLGEIYLHREKDKPDFDDEDLFTLRLLQPHVSTIFGIIHSVTAIQYLETTNPSQPRKGICVFDRELSLIGGNVTGFDLLKIHTVFNSSLLYHIKELCADILDDALQTHKGDPFYHASRLKTLDGDVQIEIFSKSNPRNGRHTRFVVLIEFCDDRQLTADYKFKFTTREAAIIDGIIQGKNNAQLAKAHNLSENTIKTHIQNIYKKTGASNRAELTYVLMLNRDS